MLARSRGLPPAACKRSAPGPRRSPRRCSIRIASRMSVPLTAACCTQSASRAGIPLACPRRRTREQSDKSKQANPEIPNRESPALCHLLPSRTQATRLSHARTDSSERQAARLDCEAQVVQGLADLVRLGKPPSLQQLVPVEDSRT
eukprot:scaffold1484_cov241-Pinguiococcus_pyrenoidosus.AAC.8